VPNPYHDSRGRFASKGAGGGGRRIRTGGGGRTRSLGTNNSGSTRGTSSLRTKNLTRKSPAFNDAVVTRKGSYKTMNTSGGRRSVARPTGGNTKGRRLTGDTAYRGTRIGHGGRKITIAGSTVASNGNSAYARGFKNRYTSTQGRGLRKGDGAAARFRRSGFLSQTRAANREVAANRSGRKMATGTGSGRLRQTSSRAGGLLRAKNVYVGGLSNRRMQTKGYPGMSSANIRVSSGSRSGNKLVASNRRTASTGTVWSKRKGS